MAPESTATQMLRGAIERVLESERFGDNNPNISTIPIMRWKILQQEH